MWKISLFFYSKSVYFCCFNCFLKTRNVQVTLNCVLVVMFSLRSLSFCFRFRNLQERSQLKVQGVWPHPPPWLGACLREGGAGVEGLHLVDHEVRDLNPGVLRGMVDQETSYKVKEFSLWHKLLFSNLNIFATQCRRPYIFQTMNSVRSNNLRFTQLGCTGRGISKFKFDAKT